MDELEICFIIFKDEMSIVALQKQDPVIIGLFEAMEANYPKLVDVSASQGDNVLYHIGSPVRDDPKTRLQLVIPKLLKGTVMTEIHSQHSVAIKGLIELMIEYGQGTFGKKTYL